MCRLAWQLLGMLGNVLGLLGMLRNVLGMLYNVLGMLATSSASSACFPQGPRSPTSKKYPPTCCLISCEAKGVVYHQASIGCCKACLGCCEACLGGRACLHILGSYINIFFSFTLWIIVTRWESLLIIKSLSFWDKEFNQNWFYFFGWQDIWTCTQDSLPKRFFFGLTQENNLLLFFI